MCGVEKLFSMQEKRLGNYFSYIMYWSTRERILTALMELLIYLFLI